MARVSEGFTPGGTLRVDRKAGVIRGVKLIGEQSLNGRRYPIPVIRAALDKYDGARANINHPRERESLERDFRDWVGVIRKPTIGRGGAYGELHIKRSHPDFEGICEAAERFPGQFGLSHVADIDSDVDRSGVEIVKSINQVYSVDVVTEPATTAGIFEARRTVKRTLKAIREANGGRVRGPLKPVFEMLEAAMPEAQLEMPMGAGTGGGADQQIKAGILAAITEKLVAASPEQLKGVLAALGIGDSVSALLTGQQPAQAAPQSTNTDGGAPPSDPPADGGDKPADKPFPPTDGEGDKGGEAKGEPMAADDKKRAEEAAKSCPVQLRRVKAENLLLRSGRDATDIQVEAVAALDESKWKAAVESFPPSGAKIVQEQRAPRPGSSPPAFGGDHDSDDGYAARESALQERLKAIRESAYKAPA